MPSSLIKRLALGAAAGLAGTIAIRLSEVISQKVAPQSLDPIRRSPGKHMVEQLEAPLPFKVRLNIPEVVETIASEGAGYVYGASFGALYAATRPAGGPVYGDGPVLGMICWAVGYLGWLPAMRLMNPIWKHRPAEIAGPIVRHAVYGVTTVAAYDALEKMA
ncbi:MAG TPA: hypothetical protein VG722_03445 [Tepidisphaeraceae bacterium]|nr:hypothetical protein [Tepidisphaeraceae bacterium]